MNNIQDVSGAHQERSLVSNLLFYVVSKTAQKEIVIGVYRDIIKAQEDIALHQEDFQPEAVYQICPIEVNMLYANGINVISPE